MENKQLKCLVPDCYNEVGVLLPCGPKVKQEWLKLFGLEHQKSSSNNFVCLEHLNDEVEPETLQKIGRKRSQKKVKKSLNNGKNIENLYGEDENSQIIQLSEDQRFEITTDSLDSQDFEITEETYTRTCRLCMTELDDSGEYIYDKIDGSNTIAKAIKTCIYPLKVSRSDQLPQYICKDCLEKLKDFYQFHQSCIAMYEKQRDVISQCSELIKIKILEDSDVSQESREDFQETNKTTDTTNNNLTTIPIEHIKKGNTSKKSHLDKKFDKVEKELLKVLGGDNKKKKTNEDAIYTENIVIEMINDDEQNPGDATHSLLNNSNLAITIKPVKQNSTKRRGVKRKNNDSSNNDDDNLVMITAGKHSNELVVLPKGISVEVLDKFTSPLGIFQCTPIKYIFGMTFLSADDYLYDYGLTKQSKRFLRCVNYKCPGRAVQKYKPNSAELENEIEIIQAHDHQPFDQRNKEMQMCYNYLFKKMQKDKSYNIKVAYEEMCEKNPGMQKLLPLRKILNEIFKYSSANDIQTPSTFDEFYDTIEHENYYKIHFTDHGIQFYQEKLETEDGAKAILFANSDTIKSFSNSKLLFIDASFNIDMEDFSYQLVTVLVWQPVGYYPILYAFVNKKTYDIYKKIFDFLYWTLAPKLRPKEIVTDYEVNLYCALEEIYIESNMGGSIFYFTQNLYKKICSLNLSRDLELNSNFRSIYNMLLMLPLLPAGTIVEALQNIEQQAKEMGVETLSQGLFKHVNEQWIQKVTPNLFCVHRMESRINENVVAPFKKLRDLLLSRPKSKSSHPQVTIIFVIERLIELEKFLRNSEKYPIKKSFVRDLCSTQRKIVLRAWNYIDEHPRININLFYMKVLGYIKCMENQLWIWGFYRYKGEKDDCLINAVNFPKRSEISESEIELEEGGTTVELVECTDGSTLFQNREYVLQEEEDSNEYVRKFIIEENGSIKTIDGYSVEIRNCSEDLETHAIENERYASFSETSLDHEEENGNTNNANKEN